MEIVQQISTFDRNRACVTNKTYNPMKTFLLQTNTRCASHWHLIMYLPVIGGTSPWQKFLILRGLFVSALCKINSSQPSRQTWSTCARDFCKRKFSSESRQITKYYLWNSTEHLENREILLDCVATFAKQKPAPDISIISSLK